MTWHDLMASQHRARAAWLRSELAAAGGSVTLLAQRLDYHRPTVYRLLRRHGIETKPKRADRWGNQQWRELCA